MHINQEQYRGTAHIVRYADDVLFTFDSMKEAEVFHKELIEGLEAFGLNVNESKTKIIPCGSRVAEDYAKRGKKMPTFTFLGFLHVWGKSKNQKQNEIFWRIKRRTDPKRYRKKLAELKRYLMKNRHNKRLIPYIILVVKGYMNYFAVNDNIYRIKSFLKAVARLLFRALNRRSQKKSYNWERFRKILDLNGYPQPSILVNLFFESKSYSMK